VKSDGSDLSSAESNIAGCVNNLLHSMFSFLSVSLNDKPVNLHETNYHYKAYLEKLLNCGSDASGTHLVSSLWYLDSSQELKDNNGFTTRLKYIGNSQTFELCGRLHSVLFNFDKMLINCVGMNIKLTRTPEAFYLLAPTDDTKVRIKTLEATLFIRQVELKPTLLLAHANVLAMKHKAHCPVTHTHIKTLQRVLGLRKFLLIMHSLGRCQTGFL